MISWTLATSAGLGLVAAVAFVQVATRFARWRRGTDPEERHASRAFAIWWYAMAAFATLHAAQDLSAALGFVDLGTFVLLRVVTLMAAGAAFGGLTYYVLYVRTGDTRWSPRLRVYYTVATLGLILILLLAPPTGVEVRAWRTDFDYADGSAPLLTALVAVFTLPAIVAAVAYLRLAPRASDPTQRRRILVTGVSIAIWLASVTVSRALTSDALQLITRPVVGTLVALAMLTVAPPREAARTPSEIDALRHRVADLV